MVKMYLLDTGFITLCLTNNLPEKWVRPWEEIQEGIKTGCVIESIIAESYYQLLIKYGLDREKANESILRFKAVKGTRIMSIDNNTAILAGYYRIRFKKFSLSLVDCFLLATGYKNRNDAKIYTTDEKLKIASKDIFVPCDYLPIR